MRQDKALDQERSEEHHLACRAMGRVWPVVVCELLGRSRLKSKKMGRNLEKLEKRGTLSLEFANERDPIVTWRL